MHRTLDTVIGRTREAAAALTNNNRLKPAAHVDQAKSSVRRAVDRARRTVTGGSPNGKQA